MRLSSGFVLCLALAFLGCAPIDEAEPTGQVSLAGGSAVGACVPDRIVSAYAINLRTTGQYGVPLLRLDVPCGSRSVYRDRSSLSGPACYGPGEPVEQFEQADLLPTPQVAPLDGQAATPVSGVRCMQSVDVFLPNPDYRLFLIVVPAASLRAVESQSGTIASWGQRYRRQVRTDLLNWDGFDIPGLFWKETYDRHAAIIFRRNSSAGTWADRIEMGANSFQLYTANEEAACHSDPLTGELGDWYGHTSAATTPWTQIRYVTCGPTQSLFDARAVLSSTGVNPNWALFSSTSRLGDYINQTLGRNPPLPDHLQVYRFSTYDTPDGEPLPL